MRMGIGVTGYLQATEEQKSWLAPSYEYLRRLDNQYSQKMGFPRSIKLCTTKPSGTLSLLAGVTPGVHPAYSQYYIRRIRFASNSPLVNFARDNGYPVEYVKNFDGTDDLTTYVVEFPVKVPEGTILAKQCTAIQQLEYVKRLQAEWSDNAVSCTVYYKKEELAGIKEWLRANYRNCIKSVSFLLHSEHGFKQAPYEEITREKYEEMASKCKNLQKIDVSYYGNKVTVEDLDMISQGECTTGACPLR
jgi:ribonucleoside-triphosphate reductase